MRAPGKEDIVEYVCIDVAVTLTYKDLNSWQRQGRCLDSFNQLIKILAKSVCLRHEFAEWTFSPLLKTMQHRFNKFLDVFR